MLLHTEPKLCKNTVGHELKENVLHLGVPIGHVHNRSSLKRFYASTDNLFTAEHRRHLLRRSYLRALGSLVYKLGFNPTGTEAGGANTVFSDLGIKALRIM